MNNRLTQDQLQKIVAEVGQLEARRQEELEPEQVREILQELNLPPELLNDAMIQLQRREALEVQQRRNRWIWGGAIASLAVLITGAAVWFQQDQQAFSRLSAQQDRITLEQNDSGNLTTVTRPAQLAYRITLQDAPIGKTLALRCDWLNPNGQVVKQNRYDTRQITTEVWETRCRYQLSSDAPTGTWTVKLFLGDRQLSDATVEVR